MAVPLTKHSKTTPSRVREGVFRLCSLQTLDPSRVSLVSPLECRLPLLEHEHRNIGIQAETLLTQRRCKPQALTRVSISNSESWLVD